MNNYPVEKNILMFEIIVTYLCLDHQYPDISNFQGQTRSYGQCYKTFMVVIGKRQTENKSVTKPQICVYSKNFKHFFCFLLGIFKWL